MKTYKFKCAVSTTAHRGEIIEDIEVIAHSREAAEKRLFKLGAGVIQYLGESAWRYPEISPTAPGDGHGKPSDYRDKRCSIIGLKARHYSFN